MVLNVLLTWNEFWQSVGEFFKNFFDSLYVFWINPSYHDETITEPPFLGVFIFAVIFLIVGFFIIKLILIIARRFMRLDKNKFIKDRSFKRFLYNTFKYILYIVLFILFFLILGIELTGVSTIISSALLAIGLSLQDVISNFASGLIILTSKPFLTGDYIKVENESVEGSVVDVRFLVTTIETVNKQLVTIPNKTITSSVLTNYTRNPLRRIVVDVGVDYSTDIDRAKKVLIDLANSDDRILENPKPVCYVTAFESSDINLSLRCYVPNVLYWDVYFELNEKILIEFNRQNIQIPYNRLVVQTLDEDGKVKIKKEIKANENM